MKLKQQYETEVYLSGAGYFCIKQESEFQKDPNITMLSPSQMQAVSAYWESIKEEHGDVWDGEQD